MTTLEEYEQARTQVAIDQLRTAHPPALALDHTQLCARVVLLEQQLDAMQDVIEAQGERIAKLEARLVGAYQLALLPQTWTDPVSRYTFSVSYATDDGADDPDPFERLSSAESVEAWRAEADTVTNLRSVESVRSA